MPPWWDTWVGRLEAEMQSFRDHDLEFVRDGAEFERGRLVLHGSIAVNDVDVALDVIYPDTYPFSRFAVLAPDLELTRHQHPFGKTLCVFPRGSAHWDRRFLAGHIIAERVPELIDAVRSGGDALRAVEEPQGEPFTDYYSYWPFGGILVPDEILNAAKNVGSGQFTITMSNDAEWLDAIATANPTVHPHIGSAMVTSLSRGQQRLADVAPALAASLRGPTWSGHWIRLEAPPATTAQDEFLHRLQEANPKLGRLAHHAGSKVEAALFGVVFPEEIRQGEYDDAWVFGVAAKPRRAKAGRRSRGRPPQDDVVRIALLRGLRCGIPDLAQRVPEVSPLQTKTVSVLGLGTLGAPIAKEMARALIGDLRVADHDFTDPATAVRWQTGFDSAGIAKALVIADDLSRNYPYTTTKPHTAWLGAAVTGDDEGDTELLEALGTGTDLIIDATAEDNAAAAVAYYASTHHIPFITVWSLEGAGGVIARIISGETGCFHCLELHLSPDHGAIQLPAPYGTSPTQPRGCADPTFTAVAPDLLPLVDHASRVAFGELCRESDDAYPRYRGDVHVLFLREPDGTLTEPPRWESHPLDVHPDCPCHRDE